MKVLICGSRYDWTNLSPQEENIMTKRIAEAILKGLRELAKNRGEKVSEIISGGALGVDRVAEGVANSNGVDLVIFPANWKKYGKRGGIIGNEKMVKYIGLDGAILAIWDGESKGTESTIKLAKVNRIDHEVIILKKNEALV